MHLDSLTSGRTTNSSLPTGVSRETAALPSKSRAGRFPVLRNGKKALHLSGRALILGALCALVLAAQPSAAQTLRIGAVNYLHDSRQGREDYFTPEYGLNLYLSSRWDLEVTYLSGESQTKSKRQPFKMQQRSLSGIYKFEQIADIQPLLLIGFGTQDVEQGSHNINDSIFTTGCGVTISASDRFVLRTDMRIVNNLDAESTDYIFAFSLGWRPMGQ